MRFSINKEPVTGVDPRIPDLFHDMALLPAPIHPMFLKLVQQLADQIVEIQNKEFEVSTLGPERVILFHTLKDHWPDVTAHRSLEKALKLAVQLDDMGQAALCLKLHEPVRLVALYCACCEETNTPYNGHDIKRVMETALEQGGLVATDWLKQLFPDNQALYAGS